MKTLTRKDSPCFLIRILIIKMSVLSKLIFQCNAISINISTYFMVLDKLVLKFIWKNKHSRVSKKTLKKESYGGGWGSPNIN